MRIPSIAATTHNSNGQVYYLLEAVQKVIGVMAESSLFAFSTLVLTPSAFLHIKLLICLSVPRSSQNLASVIPN